MLPSHGTRETSEGPDLNLVGSSRRGGVCRWQQIEQRNGLVAMQDMAMSYARYGHVLCMKANSAV